MIIIQLLAVVSHIKEAHADSTIAYRHYYTGGGDVNSANQYLADYLSSIKRLQGLNVTNKTDLNNTLSVIVPNNQGVPYIDSDNKHSTIPGFKAVPVWDTIESSPLSYDENVPLEVDLERNGNLNLQEDEIGLDVPLSDESITTGAYPYNEDFPQCPDGLTLHQTSDNNLTCYKMVDPTPFPPQCPYPLHIDYYFYKNIYLTQLTNKIVWAFAQTNKYNGAYEWINFAHNVSIIGHTKNSSEMCVVINGTELVAVNCEAKYSGICIYNFDYSLDDSYCTRKLNRTCFASTLGSANKCFCIQVASSHNQSNNEFCNKLAELRDPYQNRIVARNLQHNQYCWIGAQRDHWMSDKTIIQYPHWSNYKNRNKTYGAIGTNGWILEDDRKLNCAICEVNINKYNRVRLSLKHNLTSNYIQLEIYNAIEIYQGVVCFTGMMRQFLNVTTSTSEYVIVRLWPYEQVKEDCWCKTLQLPQLTVVFSNKIKGNRNRGNLFSVTWTIPISSASQLENNKNSCPVVKSDIVQSNKFVAISKLGEDKLEMVCHLQTFPSSSTISEEYAILKKVVRDSSHICENLGSVNVCFPTETMSGSITLHWPQTNVGCTVVPQDLCLQSNNRPVTRTCSGNGISAAQWLPVNGSCAQVSISPVTVLLNGLLHASPVQASKDLSILTERETNLDAYQIHLVSQILSSIATNDNVSVKNTVSTVSNMMKLGTTNLKSSQSLLNSTDTILWSLDEILLHAEIDSSGYMSEGDEKLLMQITNLMKTDIKGLRLLSSDSRGFNSTSLEPLHHYPSDNELEENLDLALIIPETLRNEITQCAGSKDAPNVITSMFHNDVLFNERENLTGKCDGKILSVLLPGFNCTFTSPLQVIFRASAASNADVRCVSWSYGVNQMMQSIYGHWSIETAPKNVGNSSLYKLCEFSHTTHFALLVLGGNVSLSEGHTKALDIITAIGSGLSILGVVVIFLTAILFKSYRATNGVVINFSISMAAQIIFLYIAGNASHNVTLCTIFGALLHYTVLSQFFWMLTIALLQYQRYVIIFSSPPTHLVAKSCLFAWGVPLIPIIIIISISTDNYGKNSYGLCYALGDCFIFGVIVPIALIALVNLLIFLRIMISIASSRRIKVHQDRAQASALQLRLAFMLFFLLGLTWGFGLFAAIGGGVVYSYLFCLSATLQGFVLFLFFIVLNEKTRFLWMGLTNCWRKSKDYDVTRDSASSVMMRKNQGTSTDSCTDSATSDVLRKIKNRSTSQF